MSCSYPSLYLYPPIILFRLSKESYSRTGQAFFFQMFSKLAFQRFAILCTVFVYTFFYFQFSFSYIFSPMMASFTCIGTGLNVSLRASLSSPQMEVQHLKSTFICIILPRANKEIGHTSRMSEYLKMNSLRVKTALNSKNFNAMLL